MKREPNRDQVLKDLEREAAAREERRRLAEQQAAAESALRLEKRTLEDLGRQPAARDEQRGSAGPEVAPERAPQPEKPTLEDEFEARLMAYQEKLKEELVFGRIDIAEMLYKIRRFDNGLIVELNIAERRRAATQALTADKPPEQNQRQTDAPDGRAATWAAGMEEQQARFNRLLDQTDRGTEPEIGRPDDGAGRDDEIHELLSRRRDDGSERPADSADKDAKARESELAGKGEMTEAQQARLNRLLDQMDGPERDASHDLADGNGRGGRDMGP